MSAGGPSLLALGTHPGWRSLAGVVAAATWLSTLALALALVTAETAALWRDGIGQPRSVEIPAGPAQEAQADAALAALRTLPGIAAAERLSADRIRALLAPWLGEDAEIADLPLPALIDVRLSPRGSFDPLAVQARLDAIAPGARLDTRIAGQALATRLAAIATGIANAVLAAMLLAGLAATMLAARARVAAHRGDMALLHLLGAATPRLAGMFAAAAARRGTGGAIVGLALAVATILAMQAALSDATPGGVAPPRLGWHGWLLIASPAVAMIGAAMVGAAAAARAFLQRMP
jgi:cell division transport system permease protein